MMSTILYERKDWPDCPYLYNFIEKDDLGRTWFTAKHMVTGTKTIVSFLNARSIFKRYWPL